MTPVEELLQYFKLPFTLREDQVETINLMCQHKEKSDLIWHRAGCYYPVGGGKTVIATFVALYWAIHDLVEQLIVLCPPILLQQWALWLGSFEGVSVCTYRGTPGARKKLSLAEDCIITTPGLFKNDHDKFMAYFRDRKVYMIVDEAVVVRQVGTLMHIAVREFVNTPHKMLSLLTGTTISAPHQSYGYIKLIAPEIYRDYRHFTMLHITRLDQFKTPCEYKNLDLLADNMKVQTVKKEASEILDLPDVTYVPVPYDLDPGHKRLYDKVVDDLLVTLDDGTILDGLIPQRMRNTAQRVVLMPAEFGGEKIKPAGFGLINEMTTELGNDKVMIYCNFQSSNEAVFDHCEKLGLNPVLVYGGQRSTAKLNLAALERFKTDPLVRVLVGNPRSCGIGVDGLQHICHAVLFLELPTPAMFIQATGRIDREGQKSKCVVKIAVARATIQVSLQQNALRKEDLVQKVVPTKASLRRALKGGPENDCLESL